MNTVSKSRAVLATLAMSVSLAAIATTGAVRQVRAEGAPAQQLAELSVLIDDHRHVITGTYEEPAGPGFAFLVEQGAASEFLLLGESHQTAETPPLFHALARELRPAGYSAIALEIGPLSARDLTARIGEGGVAAHTASVRRYPFTLPFFELRPEAELVAAALAEGYEIWGLDQEFVGSGRYWLDRLAAVAPNEEARALVASWQERELAAVQHYQQTQSTERTIYQSATPEDFDALRAAFGGPPARAADGNDASGEALAIIDAMATSARIYQLWRTENYENNRQRVDYMRANLATNLRTLESSRGAPKVLMKFGSYHMGRGRSPANQYDLGNMALQLAAYRGGRSLHVQALARGMRGADGAFSSWDGDEPVWRLIAERVDPDQPWTVFDLRPLRPYFHRQANRAGNESTADTVWAYDLLAIAPEFHPAEPLVEGT